jgi:DEAD/DEAH box helicase domain-containing protein
LTDLTDLYQRLVELELEKLRSSQERFADPASRLDEHDIQALGGDTADLLSRKLLVNYGTTFRTAHVDLLFRVYNIRYREQTEPLVLERKLHVIKEAAADFGAHPVAAVVKELARSKALSIGNDTAEIIGKVFDAIGYHGLSTFQKKYVEEVILRQTKSCAMVAPTAFGKSLAFYLVAIVRALEGIETGKHSISSIFLYPRKALGRNQIQKILQIIDLLNASLEVPITVAIDDGDTLEMEDRARKHGSTKFRELRCVREGCEAELQLHDNGRVVCSGGRHSYQYLIATRDEMLRRPPHILVSNVWMIYRKMLDPKWVALLKELDLVVIDEAHVHTGYQGGHISMVLRMLRYVTSLGNKEREAFFIFSSATIPNPKEFISSLGGFEEDEIYWKDYSELSGEGVGKRILLYVYLLPNPAVSGGTAESLTEAIMEAIILWCHKHDFRAIAFADSIANVTIFMSYFHDTILGTRKGREILDHIYDETASVVSNPENDYSWVSLSPSSILQGKDAAQTFLTGPVKQSIDFHYGDLRPAERASKEEKFRTGEIKLMISTSTLELGIDLSQIAAIVQYKLPMTEEAVPQRIGRAGRVEECQRISIGFIVLPATPTGTLYMYSDDLTKRLEDVQSMPPHMLGVQSENIAIQHTISLLLLSRALEGKETYMKANSIKSWRDAEISCASLRKELENVRVLNDRIHLFEDKILQRALRTVEEAFDATTIKIPEGGGFDDAERTLDSTRGQARQALESCREFVRIWPTSLPSIFVDTASWLEKVRTELEEVKTSFKEARRGREHSAVASTRLGELLSSIPDSDVILDELVTLVGLFPTRELRGRGIEKGVILRLLPEIRDHLAETDDSVRQLSVILEAFSGIDLRTLAISSIRADLIREVTASQARGIEILKAVSLLVGRESSLSPLFTHPLPLFGVVEQ